MRNRNHQDSIRDSGTAVSPALAQFIDEALSRSRAPADPSDAVLDIAPLMMELSARANEMLREAHLRSDPAHYTRNLIYCAPDNCLSLYALVWLPGQWTPVHDHGSWGVVGVVEGVLEERSFVRQSADDGRDEGIALARGGVVLLPPRAVSTFVPNPDHIHITGVPAGRPRAVSLHLYGRTMSDFNLYDVEAGTRRRIAVAHNES
jgi:predicted metal-dependent enzyme (double-stranded beta helix superfamily)